MTEFVVVTFSRKRSVNIDGAPRGETGDLLRMQAGTHHFDLGLPPDYTPSSVLTPVRGTSEPAPMVIAFAPLPLRPAVSRRRAKGTRAKAAKKTATRKRPRRKAAAAKRRARKTRARRARKRGSRTRS